MDLSEFYQERRAEIDLLADDAALFLLTFLESLGSATLFRLRNELGWPTTETEVALSRLFEGGFVTDDPRHGDAIIATVKGRRMLETLELLGAAERETPVEPTNALPLFAAASVVLGVFGLQKGRGRWPEFLAGLAAGCGAGMLLAAQSGQETRGRIRGTARQSWRELGRREAKLVGEINRRVKEQLDDALHTGRRASNRIGAEIDRAERRQSLAE